MDLNIINILTVILSFIAVFLVSMHLYISKHFGTLEALGIPCQKPWPFLGNIGSELFSIVHEHDVELGRKYGRIYGHYETRTPTIRVTDPEILRQVLIKQFPKFADRRHTENISDPIIRRFMTILKGEEWKQNRTLLTPAFTSGKLKHMTPMVEKCLNHLLKRIEEKSETGESFEPKEMFSAYVIDVIASYAFGIDMNAQVKDEKKFPKYAKLMVSNQSLLMHAFSTSMPWFIKLIFLPLQKRSYEGLQFFKKISYTVIKKRQTSKERKNDFLQLMLDCLEDDKKNETKDSSVIDNEKLSDENESNKPPSKKRKLSVDDIAANMVMFLFGGFETTAKTLSFAAYSLATNQECQDKLLNEIDDILEKNEGKLNPEDVVQMQYMEMVIMETLRYYPAALRVDRQCLATTKINDLVIPKNVLVVIPLYAIHHDEEFYPESYRFDPERFSPENKEKRNQFAFIGFGFGPRNCIGMRFALLLIKLTLANILKNYRFVCGLKTQVPIKFKKGQANLVPEVFEIYVEKRSTTT